MTSTSTSPTTATTGVDTTAHRDRRARVVFLVRVPAARTADFLDAYQLIRYEVADGVPGHVVDQVCRSTTDPEQWLITSEWETLASFEEWERDPAHRELAGPLRACMSEARSVRFVIEHQTSRHGERT